MEELRSNTQYLNLDELSPTKMKELMEYISGLRNYKTLILFTSPQCIPSKELQIIPYILNGQSIWFVLVDEIHIVSHFGRSSRDEFVKLKSALFQKIMDTIPILFLMATCKS